MYSLIHYKYTNVKGKYTRICTITYADKWTALADGETMFEVIDDPNYAGFLIKDKDGNTICRRKK